MASYGAITKVVSLTYLNSFRFTASRLAQEGMELVSNTRDTNWLNENDWDSRLLINCASGCEIDYTYDYNDGNFSPYTDPGKYLQIDSNGFYNYGDGDDSRFKRKIIITQVNADELKIKVEVTWSELGSSLETLETLEVEEHLYNWR
jgi:hypothetical protein